ncbi:hypothetical protein CCACVL1_18699 [Corchorus capsularis]|uniref:Hydroxyproline-rich glycoprotein family protein n=1 Tax=Corchorus capsularis TaxID=210143 RepID=A0A1R3HJY7_COCAP|nr:hypothetical protein CCACVL1_18699 [Corchorus capsularis]
MEDDEDMTPFWLQTTDNRRHRRRVQPSSFFFNSGVLIILLLVVAFAFIFVIIPSFLSFTSQIFKPQLVKKSWDSLNLVLVLFAIICGFLSKSNSNNNDNDSRSGYEDYKFSSTPKHVRSSSNPSTPREWYEYSSASDRTAFNSLQRLRSSSSYPDLRQESSWVMNGEDRWRFYDDTRLYSFRSRSRREYDEDQVYRNNVKDIAVDTVQTPPPPPSPPPPALTHQEPEAASPPRPPQSPPLQPPKVARRKPKRTYEDPKPKEESESWEVINNTEMKIKHSLPPTPSVPALPPPSPPPPPPPPPPAVFEKRSHKSEKKRGGVTKDFLISLRRKKKKQRQKSVENLDEFFNLSTLPLYPPPSPPPPPPPPPPPLPSFYQNIFSSKKTKARKYHSVPPAPPPPQPALEARASKREPQRPPVTTHKPPLPVKIRNIKSVEESVESGNESPLNPIPPPPPPPPFKMPPLKFEVHGDYVRLKSIRSGSPDFDDPLSGGEGSPSDGNRNSTGGPLFCPSPDVDTKADNFIARFRAGLKLEKLNSVKGRSNLGLDPGPSTV